jgi:dTDP-4-dehydrorhamnose 3,5-epimerase
LSENATISYKCDQFYNKQSESGIRYNDNLLKIDWQIPAGKELISEKDAHMPGFNPSLTDFIYSGDA